MSWSLVSRVMECVRHGATGHEAPKGESRGRMGMDHVETVPAHLLHGPGDMVQVGHMVRGPLTGWITPTKCALGQRIARGEQRHLVPPADQSFHQRVDDKFGSPVVPGRDTEKWGGDHRNLHDSGRFWGTGPRPSEASP